MRFWLLMNSRVKVWLQNICELSVIINSFTPGWFSLLTLLVGLRSDFLGVLDLAGVRLWILSLLSVVSVKFFEQRNPIHGFSTETKFFLWFGVKFSAFAYWKLLDDFSITFSGASSGKKLSKCSLTLSTRACECNLAFFIKSASWQVESWKFFLKLLLDLPGVLNGELFLPLANNNKKEILTVARPNKSQHCSDHDGRDRP